MVGHIPLEDGILVRVQAPQPKIMSKKILILFLSCFLIFSANILAGEYDVEGGGTISYKGFVPCGYDLNGSGEIDIWERCQLCHFFVMIDGIIEFVFDKIVPPLAILMLVVAGILLFSAGAAPAMKNKVKNMILYVGLGLVLIYSCWLLVSFLLSVFGVVEWTDPLGQGWFKIDCPISRTFVGGTKNPFKPGKNLGWHEEPKKPSGPPPPPPGDEKEDGSGGRDENENVDCSDLKKLCDSGKKKELAKCNNVPYLRQNAPILQNFLNCLRKDNFNFGSVYTWDETNDICNYTRGHRYWGWGICPNNKCSHTKYSCHYGGRYGTEGALAVDFGNQNLFYNDVFLNAVKNCSIEEDVDVAVCIYFEKDHIHVSFPCLAAECDYKIYNKWAKGNTLDKKCINVCKVKTNKCNLPSVCKNM